MTDNKRYIPSHGINYIHGALIIIMFQPTPAVASVGPVGLGGRSVGNRLEKRGEATDKDKELN